jgi:CPA1 family monovalent cation:H+ antiporter
VETILLLVTVALLIAVVARYFDQPYPIALLLGGVGIASIPGAPSVALSPDVVFYLLLPPILSEAAFFTSWRDFLYLKRPILILAFGLVAVTSAVVATLCVYFIPGMSWATGFVLGAIVSPPDAAAATSITRVLKLPKRIVQILEGESLVNDASALTLYRFAVIAVAGGGLTWQSAAESFVWIVAGGTLIGLALGYGYVRIFRWIRDPELEIVSTFLLSYLSYFLAEHFHSSGVLATVASGILLGWHSPDLFSANTRMRGFAVWRTVIFLINAAIFLLIGMQLPAVMAGLGGYPAGQLLGWCAIILAGVILTRLLWVYPGTYLPRLLSKTIREREPRPTPQGVFVVGWTGLRGVVSLAGAMALPLETERGLPFPYRNLILVITFAVIAGTLVIQGLPLRWIVRKLGLPADHSSEQEELTARIATTEKVIERILEMAEKGECQGAVFDRVRGYYEDRLADLRARLEIEAGSEELNSPERFATLAEQRIWWHLAGVERKALIDLRREMRIGDEALRQIERDLDLLEERITARA